MTDFSADDRIATIALAVHYLTYPRRQRRSAAAFARLVAGFVDPSTRAQLADGVHPAAAAAVITTAKHCANAVRRL